MRNLLHRYVLDCGNIKPCWMLNEAVFGVAATGTMPVGPGRRQVGGFHSRYGFGILTSQGEKYDKQSE